MNDAYGDVELDRILSGELYGRISLLQMAATSVDGITTDQDLTVCGKYQRQVSI